MPQEFKVKNGLIVDQGGATITGSVTATSGFTGSLFGTASFALAVAGGGGGGVTHIIAGTNVTISPAGGTGAVTINSSGGGGGSTFPFT